MSVLRRSMILVVSMVLIMTTQVGAVTNYVVTTNVISAKESFRVVRGRLYNSEKAQGWREVNAECRAVFTNIIVVQEFTVKKLYEERKTTPLGRTGVFTGGGAPPRVLDQWREYGKFVAITNCEDKIFVGDTVRCIALPVGDFLWKQNMLELLDRGIRHQSIVIKTNKIPNGR